MFATYRFEAKRFPVTETFPFEPVILAVVKSPFVVREVRLPKEVIRGWLEVDTVP